MQTQPVSIMLYTPIDPVLNSALPTQLDTISNAIFVAKINSSTHLQAQMVSRNVLLQLGRFGRIEFYGKLKHPDVGFEEFRHRSLQIEPNTWIGRCCVQQAEVVLFDDVQTGAYRVDQIFAFRFALGMRRLSEMGE